MEENGVRINKFLSEAGVCSRREADSFDFQKTETVPTEATDIKMDAIV